MAIKKSFLTCLLILSALLLALSGCASSSSGGTSTPTSTAGGLKTDFGVDTVNKTITLGILSPYSGPVAAPIGIPLARGVEVFFDAVNAAGGIGGYQVKFLKGDSKYAPQTQVEQYNLIRNKVLMIADSLGTPTTFAIKDLATQDQMLVSAATLSSALAREKYIILVGTPYRLQVENAFDYVVNKLGMTHPATGIIYQNDDYGMDGLTGYKEAVTAYNLNDVAQASYGLTDTSYAAQITQLKNAGAKYVFITSTPTVTAKIIGTAAALNYSPQWILQSPAFSTRLLGVPQLVPLLSKAWVVSQGATWGDTTQPGMKDLLAAVANYAPDQQADGFFEFGYTESKITYAILKKAIENNDITRAGLLAAFESLKNVDLGGLLPNVSYGATPDERVPARDSVIYIIDPTQPTKIKPLTADFTGSAAMQSKF